MQESGGILIPRECTTGARKVHLWRLPFHSVTQPAAFRGKMSIGYSVCVLLLVVPLSPNTTACCCFFAGCLPPLMFEHHFRRAR